MKRCLLEQVVHDIGIVFSVSAGKVTTRKHNNCIQAFTIVTCHRKKNTKSPVIPSNIPTGVLAGITILQIVQLIPCYSSRATTNITIIGIIIIQQHTFAANWLVFCFCSSFLFPSTLRPNCVFRQHLAHLISLIPQNALNSNSELHSPP